MTLTITLCVLLAAILHAAWNAMVKSTADRLVMMTWIAAATSIIAIPFIPAVGVPPRQAWPYLGVTICIHTAYMLLLVRAYSHGDFGQVYPLARGLAPALVTIAGFIFAGETLSPVPITGICLIALGITSLAWRRKPGVARDMHAIGYALATGLTIATYSVIDGMGGRVADTPLQYATWLFLLYSGPLVLVSLARRGPAAIFASRRVALTGLGGAAMSMLAYAIVIWAMRYAPMGPVSALRETSVVFGALISGYILKEGLGSFAIVASAVVALGVILLRFNGL